jgi:hypothetical protein
MVVNKFLRCNLWASILLFNIKYHRKNFILYILTFWCTVAISIFIIVPFTWSVYCYPGHAICFSCILLFSATKIFVLHLIQLILYIGTPILIGHELFVIILSPVSNDCLKTSIHHYKSHSNAGNWKDLARSDSCFQKLYYRRNLRLLHFQISVLSLCT